MDTALTLILDNLNLLIFISLVLIGYFAGSRAERKHYASIEARERDLLHLAVVTAEGRFAPGRVEASFLVSGSVVISVDYFKRLLASLRNIFGGRVQSYESLVDRARREAVLRMKEAAIAAGADMIANLRLETASVGNKASQKGGIGCVEVIAYGTAIVFIPKKT